MLTHLNLSGHMWQWFPHWKVQVYSIICSEEVLMGNWYWEVLCSQGTVTLLVSSENCRCLHREEEDTKYKFSLFINCLECPSFLFGGRLEELPRLLYFFSLIQLANTWLKNAYG